MTFSEFGRRVKENASQGTDHGAAAPLFVIGGKVKSGAIGKHPSLTDLDREGDLKHHTDFRRVYATVLDQLARLPQPRGPRRAVRGRGLPGLNEWVIRGGLCCRTRLARRTAKPQADASACGFAAFQGDSRITQSCLARQELLDRLT